MSHAPNLHCWYKLDQCLPAFLPSFGEDCYASFCARHFKGGMDMSLKFKAEGKGALRSTTPFVLCGM